MAADAPQRPTRPWVNVLANPGFDAHISEAGGGYTWALNSRLNQLTPWSNDPVGDPPGEWFLLQEIKSRNLWRVSPSAWTAPSATYRVALCQDYSVVSHRRGDLDVRAAWCVDTRTAVKQVRLRLVNRGQRTQRLRAIGIAEWVMGAGRGDRASTDTASFTQRLPDAAQADPRGNGAGRKLSAPTCTQRDRSAGSPCPTCSCSAAVPGWACVLPSPPSSRWPPASRPSVSF